MGVVDHLSETVFVVDDDPAVRESIAALATSLGLEAETFESAERFLEQYDPQRLGCVVVDLRLPGMSGLALLEELAGRCCAIPVILISAYVRVPEAVRAMQWGAVTVIEKPYPANRLSEALQSALARSRKMHVARLQRIDVMNRLESLSPRERRVLDLMIEDRPNKVIAREIGVSRRTLDRLRSAVLEKLGVRSAVEAARLSAGIVPCCSD
jgi:FixJ family two-component response regulator